MTRRSSLPVSGVPTDVIAIQGVKSCHTQRIGVEGVYEPPFTR